MSGNAIAQALLAAALFGMATPFSKTLLSGLQANQLAGLLYLGAAAFILPFTLRRVRKGAKVLPSDAKNRGRLALSIVFGGIIGPVMLLLGLKQALASSVSMWLSLEATATALIAFAFFGENLGKWTWLGNCGVVAASALLGYGEGHAGLVGLLCILAATLAWGIDNNATAGIDGIAPEDTVFWKGLFAGGANLLIGIALFDWKLDSSWLWSLLLGGVAYGGSIALYIRAAQKAGATRAQMAFASAPFFGVALSAILLGERSDLLQLSAAALLAVSIALPFLDKHAHRHSHHLLAHTHPHCHNDQHHSHVHEGLPPETMHSHFHTHEKLVHTHQHLPDLHHRHH